MYVCVCNGLTSRDVRAAARKSPSTGGVYRALGVQPRCGKCIPTIRDAVAAAKADAHETLAAEPASG
jgi:bacterioferritin-associated ferredoxin